MIGFETTNSRYYINGRRKTISGGIFGEKAMRYKDIKCIVGLPAVIRLEDGQEYKTSEVQKYLTAFTM